MSAEARILRMVITSMKRRFFGLVQPPLATRFEFIINDFIQPGFQHAFTKLPSANLNDSGLTIVQNVCSQRTQKFLRRPAWFRRHIFRNIHYRFRSGVTGVIAFPIFVGFACRLRRGGNNEPVFVMVIGGYPIQFHWFGYRLFVRMPAISSGEMPSHARKAS